MKTKSYLLILAAAVLWGIISIFVNALSQMGISPMQLSVIRFLFSAVLLALYFAAADRRVFKIKIRDFGYFIGTGIIGLAFFTVCYFKTIETLGVSVAVVFLYSAPVFVSLISAAVFKEKLTSVKAMAVFMTVIGCVFVSGIASGGADIGFISLLTALGAGFGYGMYTIFCKCLINKGYGSETITLYTFITAAAGVLPFFKCEEFALILNPKGMAISVLFALITTVLPYLFYSRGLKNTDASIASVIASAELAVGSLVGFLIFDEPAGALKILGIMLIIAAVSISNLKGVQQ